MTKPFERETKKLDHLNGGAGFVILESLINDEQKGEHCGLFSRVTIKADCELGYHEHHGETETYYILSGKGMYDDNGKAVAVEAGDVLFCKDGDGHGMKNTGYADLEFIALILKK
ncbi:MAG: cupin domain-containing protein [Hespellia sp.]|nr:cupin domain-containing protein [Hespellia sp.]